MGLHISAKLCALGLVCAALIMAYGSPRAEGVPLAVEPTVALREEPIARETATPIAQGPPPNLVLEARATGYNSTASQTDATPHVTATGTRTRFGVLAVSRDLLGDDVPYGSLVRLQDLGTYHEGRGPGRFQALLDGQDLFVVEDTMHRRKENQVDLWFSDYASAVNWGVRRVRLKVVRYGYDGPMLDLAASADFDGTPRLLAGR